MQVRAEQLTRQLGSELKPVYLIAGDEPFQQAEAADLVRATARKQGFLERTVFSSDTGISWQDIYNEAGSMSLFGGQRLIEIRLGSKRPDKAGSETLVQLLNMNSPDTLFLITCSRLDRRKDMKSRWVTTVDKQGVVTEIWPVPANRLHDWINRRLASHKLSASTDAVELLAQRSEGNLLACAQEIEKLALLCPGGSVEPADVQQAVGNSSRFTPFDLAEATTDGDSARALRILDTLAEEGVEAPVILWAMAREIRAMCAMAEGKDPGIRMPPQRLRAMQTRARQLGLPRLQQAQLLAARADQQVKGLQPGRAADTLAEMVLKLTAKV